MTMHILENVFKDHYYMRTIIFQSGRFIFFHQNALKYRPFILCMLPRTLNYIRYMPKLENVVQMRPTPNSQLFCLFLLVFEIS